ncbi:MAG: UDP-N-acetylmuramoyl-tripeptide--D-alanyl-D-alanine ligase [Fusicatenibacter sp.]|nr:UDP-N-acetylmuramoyl-tripeptide--D-alanyl-D-alanine ligase [Fusicatenibacter sp.]MDY2937178.1 UDP-N-acetylmuramoyl-tripeptide--D-alanyl-D-alanine ligase [Fusicatenibacter sp.]
MKNMTLEQIAAACGGRYCGPKEKRNCEVSEIVTDSRKAGEGCLFVAIPGARVDGHDFIPGVVKAGALAVISEKDLGETDFPYIQVASSLKAVKDMAEYYLEQLGIPVIGITGSVGKTSTKETIASVLAQKYRVLKTEGNFNNELGLPLTVFRLREEHQIAVLEMGISDFGEMHRLARIARPDTAVITNIGWCHLENLKTRDGILQAKTEIFDYLKEDGHILLNGDDDKLSTVGEVKGITPIRFGLNAKNEYYADEIQSQGFLGISCRIHTPEGTFSALVPIPGRHMVYNALAATAVGCVYGLTLEQIRRGIESLKAVNGRFHIIETGRYTVIDDCYNANPVSMKASLDVLGEGSGRKVAVLGDMGELGEDEAKLHAEVGTHAAGCGIDALYLAGPLCAHLAKAAQTANPALEVRHFGSREELQEALGGLLQEGDNVLVKASHFMQFEKIVAALTEGNEK